MATIQGAEAAAGTRTDEADIQVDVAGEQDPRGVPKMALKRAGVASAVKIAVEAQANHEDTHTSSLEVCELHFPPQ